MMPEEGDTRDLLLAPLPRRHAMADLLVGLACPECHGPLIPNNILNMLLMGLLVTQSQGAPSLLCENCRPHRQYPFIFNEIPDFRPKSFGKEAPVGNYHVSLPASPAWLVKMKRVMAWPIWALVMVMLALHPKRTSFWKAEKTVGKWLRLARKKQGDSIYNIHLKTLESYYFSTHVPEEPSLEFGGNWGNFTNDIYTGSCRITYSSEYLGESFFSGDAPHPNRHDVFDSLFLSEAHRLPIPGGTLNTVLSMHILDHIIKIDDLFSEVSRTLRSGGHFHASTYGRDIWLPEFPILKLFGLLGKRYRNWRLRRPNPRGGDAYQREGVYPTGQNLLSEEQWRELGRRHGLNLVEVKPFSRRWLFGLLVDIEYQGFYCPPRMAERVARLLLPICGREAEKPPAFNDAFNVFLTFRKN